MKEEKIVLYPPVISPELRNRLIWALCGAVCGFLFGVWL
jgi:hypothetical protein